MSDTEKPAAVVIGVGAVGRGDDGFASAVLAALYDLPGLGGRARLAPCNGDPFRLIELWDGFAHPIVVGTARGGARPRGHIHRGELLRGKAVEKPGGFAEGGWRCGLATAARLAESLGRRPERLSYYAVRGADFGPGARISPPVAAVIPALAARIRREVLVAHQARLHVPRAAGPRALTPLPAGRHRTGEHPKALAIRS